MSAVTIPKILLNNGMWMPVIGLGTWRAKPGEVGEAVKHAIDCGIRHFDCASLYGNEKEIGSALKEKIEEGAIRRQDLFITSKLWCNSMRPDLVESAFKKSLSNFGLDYLDLYLIHWPMGFREGNDSYPMNENKKLICSDVDYVDTWKAMEAIFDEGLTKSIGVSNFNVGQMERLLQKAHIKPVVNQVEYHPYLNQKALLSLCKKNDIVVVAYSPLGSKDRPWATKSDPSLLEDITIKEMSRKYGKTSAQIILRYLIQLGVVPIPKSTNPQRIKENINIFDFNLGQEDMEVLDRFNLSVRYHRHLETADHPHYPFVER